MLLNVFVTECIQGVTVHVVTLWLHYGYTMVTLWLHYGYTMVTLWLHYGF